MIYLRNSAESTGFLDLIAKLVAGVTLTTQSSLALEPRRVRLNLVARSIALRSAGLEYPKIIGGAFGYSRQLTANPKLMDIRNFRYTFGYSDATAALCSWLGRIFQITPHATPLAA